MFTMEGASKILPCKGALGFCTSFLKRADFFLQQGIKIGQKDCFTDVKLLLGICRMETAVLPGEF